MGGLLPAKWANVRLLPFRLTPMQKVVFISLTAGVTLLGVLARLLRRRKRPSPPRRPRKHSPSDMTSLSGSKVSGRSGSPIASTVGYFDRLSIASESIGPDAVVPTAAPSQPGTITLHLTAHQLGVMGMEALDTVINHWEDALATHYSPRVVPASLTSVDESKFRHEIQNLLHMAYTLQEKSELLLLEGHGVEDVADYDRQSIVTIVSRTGSDHNCDSAESYASALDGEVGDLREFDECIQATTFEQYPLYQEALKHHEETPVPYRTLRTELMHCVTDTEYLAKLHCVRMAFQYLFKDATIRQWVSDTGRQMLKDLLRYGDKETGAFLVGYDNMVDYVQHAHNWACIQDELESRNVKVMTFYDICFDFIVLDAFRELNAPPPTVRAVMQNRFLSNGFKETAITKAVWSVVKGKKRLLKYQNGFMAHFYVISEQLSPLMAWGFFGSDEGLRDICNYFREQMLAFLKDIFNFQNSRYTNIEEFAEDVLNHMKTRVNNMGIKFSQLC